LPDLPAAAADPGGAAAQTLRRFAADEAVATVDDLLLRRGPWADDPKLAPGLRDAVTEVLAGTARGQG
jgi:hypothetical protein